MEKKTIIDLFESSVKRFPGNPFLWEKTGKRFEPTTYSKVRDLVYEEGAGLVSLGVRKGDNMALLSEGRNAWIIGELAMFYAGATNVPLSIKLEEANDLLFRLVHADVKYIMVSGQQLGKIRAIKDQLPAVRKIIVLDELAEYQDRETASSTCWYLARQLPDINIQVSTNSHTICHELGKRERIQLSSSGGTLERKYGCYVNPSLISQLKSLEIDLFIFSCEGIDSSGALWDSNAINADYKSMLLKRAAQSLLLIDKSKFNRSGEARIGHLDEVTHIISDERQVATSLVTA